MHPRGHTIQGPTEESTHHAHTSSLLSKQRVSAGRAEILGSQKRMKPYPIFLQTDMERDWAPRPAGLCRFGGELYTFD